MSANGMAKVQMTKYKPAKHYQIWVYEYGYRHYQLEYIGTLRGARKFAKEEYGIK